ncbi:MAG: phosphopantetheine-binding protein [Caldilineaceae bacterium]
MMLASLPLTANGKVDRRALPAPDFNAGPTAPSSDAPRSPIEQRLVAIWHNLLQVEQIGIHDNFFELGGHSLLAVRLMLQVEQSFQQAIVLRDFIFTPTIAHLATLLEKAHAASIDSLPASGEAALPNMPAQLASLYEQLQAPDAFQRLRHADHRERQQPRRIRILKRLPYPLACSLLRQLLRQTELQQRYWGKEVALIRRFHALLDTAVSPAQMVENSLFYNLLRRYGLDRRFASSPTQPALPRPPARITGLARLATSKETGAGVILASHHALARHWLRLHELSEYTIFGINEVIEREQIEHAQGAAILFARQLELATQTLRRGGVVMLGPDGYQGSGPGRTLPFHGRLRHFRTTFAELALLTGAPILPLVSEMQPGQPITMHILPPLDAGAAHLPDAVRIEQLSDQYLQHVDRAWRTMPWMLPWYQMEKHLACPPLE